MGKLRVEERQACRTCFSNFQKPFVQILFFVAKAVELSRKFFFLIELSKCCLWS